jgi:HPt (histidine-containing phosphotransfer) domain-containing protein
VLKKWVGTATSPAERAAAAAAPPAELLDEAVIQSLMSVDDDGSLMQEIVATFLRIAPARLTAIKKAARGHAAQLEREAHSFLGSCGNIGASRMAEICARLEVLGRSGSTEGAADLARTLEEELARVRPELEALPGRHPRRAGAKAPAAPSGPGTGALPSRS